MKASQSATTMRNEKATPGRASDEEAMVRAAVANLVERFAIDARDVETTVRRFVAEWFAQARVKTFVGIIAERHARMELQRLTVHGSDSQWPAE
jgi:CRP-like cAMP-binding protein